MNFKDLYDKKYTPYMSLTILILSLFTSNLYAAGNDTLLTVKLVDALDGLPMSNVRVYAFQRLSDNSLQWYQNETSDSNGQIDFDLQGIDNGGAYVFKTQRLDESGWVVSGDVKNAGSYTFYVRNVRINAVNGLNDSALTGHEIHAYQRDSNNHDTWFASAETNASGVVDFSLPDLASGQRYIFKSRSPVDNAVWYVGEEIYQSSTSTFVIGNKPLSVELVNNADQQPIANFEVSAYKRLPDNSLKWVQKQTSNVNGRVTFDLQGLGNGTVYVLEAKQEQGRNWARSDDLNNTGNYAFNIRNIRVTVVNGLNDSALTGHKIHAFKRDVNGDDSWFSASTTSASGLADFFLPGLTTGQRYVFKSLSPVDNTTWYTGEEINQSGVSNFVVGNALLELKLVNSLNQQSIANVDVTAYQRLPDNSFKWFQRKTTDSNGRIKFDLDGLGDNHQYILRASPYGIKISSKNIVDTGEFIMEAGRVAVTLRRKIDGSVLVGKKLQLLEKVAPGVFEWRASSITDQNGLVRFDPEGLDEGNVFVIYGQNFLGSNYRYYSHWVTSKGALEFVVDLDDLHKVDEEPPMFTQVLPQNQAILSDQGFTIKINVADNDMVSRVALNIIDPIKGNTIGQAILMNGEWVFLVTSNMISMGEVVTVEAEAEDHVGNKTKITFQYSISFDQEFPDVIVTSHRDGDRIEENGFLLMGTATDNTGYVNLLATVRDSINGIIVNQKSIEIGSTHHWALVVKDLSKGAQVTVELKAIDSAGNEANSAMVLNVSTDTPSMVQLINRLTFGATPELLQELRNYGSDDFIEQQLHPELIDDSIFEQKRSDVLAMELGSSDQLQNSQIVHAIYSKRQLLEVMTLFWDSHFNTDLGKVKNASLEKMENEQFRQHALGNFRDLLGVSARSPAMLRFLDNKDSHKDEPNENYARELMELHTLGVDNGYTSEDIVDVARVFTGWEVSYGEFYFNQWEHDDNIKLVLGTTIPADSGVLGGEIVLDILASQEGTAHFICTKLLQKFVSDVVSTNDVDDCASDFLTYIDYENQIALVLEGIFKSQSFSDSLNFHNKIKTPLEFFAGLARQFSVSINYYKMRKNFIEMGMPLFYYSLPTGWPEKGAYWANSNQLMVRWQIAKGIVFNSATAWKNHIVDPGNILIQHGIETTEGVLGNLFELAMDHDYSEQEWNQARLILTNNDTDEFDIYASDADMKIRQLMALILQYPTYQLQ